MESSLEWLRKIGVNLKKIYDAILDSTFGLPAIKQAINNIVIDFHPIPDKLDEMDTKIDTNTQTLLDAIADIHNVPISDEHIESLFPEVNEDL